MAVGLAEVAAGISGHESGQLQKSAGQQVKLSIHSLTTVCTWMHSYKMQAYYSDRRVSQVMLVHTNFTGSVQSNLNLCL